MKWQSKKTVRNSRSRGATGLRVGTRREGVPPFLCHLLLGLVRNRMMEPNSTKTENADHVSLILNSERREGAVDESMIDRVFCVHNE